MKPLSKSVKKAVKGQRSLWSKRKGGREDEVREVKGRRQIAGLTGYSKDFDLYFETDKKLLEGCEQMRDII